MMPALALVAAYLIGAIPFGFLLVKWKTGADIRASGSGNIGATNVLRTTGWTTGAATLALDIAKGYLAVWLAGRLTGGSSIWMPAAALAVMAGPRVSRVPRRQGRQSRRQLYRRLPLPDAASACRDRGGLRRDGGVDASHLGRLHRRRGRISAGGLADLSSAAPGHAGRHRQRRVHHLPASPKIWSGCAPGTENVFRSRGRRR